ncbi:MAG: N-acetylmuramoyl-L-alanine amidase [Deltaproteobacteria bacterium]|nr:N-acetylmuramoyl-L-alanine amidase [Deltaproteobacteria bacterium]
MKGRPTRLAGVFLLAALLFSAAVAEVWGKSLSAPESLLRSAGECQKALYKSKEKMKYRHNWLRCIETYRKLAERYPQSEQAVKGLFRAAEMYTRLHAFSGQEQDLDDAMGLYRHLADRYPKHPLADDAQYRIGEIYYEEKNDLTQAYVEFLKVDIKFPHGDMRPKARAMLDKLSAVLTSKDKQRAGKAEDASSQGLTGVQGIRHWSTPSYTRVVIDLERAVQYESHLLKEDPDLKKPRRLYVDLRNTHVSSDINTNIPIGDGLLKAARAGQYTKETVRVVLDINSIGGYKVFPLHDPFRIVIDVKGVEEKGAGDKGEKEKVEKKREEEKPKEPEKQVAKVAPKPEGKIDRTRVRRGIRKEKTPDKSLSLARQLGLGVSKIVIDPGHGGKDPGCFINGKIEEKNIVLGFAQVLARRIREKLGCEVVLTREKDVFIPLERRTAFANMQKADLFISLHINAHKQDDVHGLETYFLNMATDERAVMVAARENATSEKNISDLQKILNDLMLNTKISESSKLAHEVQKGMVGEVKKKFDRVKDLGVKQAPFYVLIGAEMPAILVEMGFITNPAERKRLLSKSYQEILADGILSGIGRYVKGIDLVYLGR